MMKLSKFQKFTSAEVARSALRNAKYNPRQIGDDERARLREGLESLGLVAPLVFNKRTGNLVSGHQRLSILDELEGTKDYRLTVARIDVSASEERRLNLLLNNPKAQGTWDDEKLKAVIEQLNGELAGTGFSADDFTQSIREAEKSMAAESFQIVVECKNGSEQGRLLKRFEREGLTCRAS